MTGNFVCHACRRRLSLPVPPLLTTQRQYLTPPHPVDRRREFSAASLDTEQAKQPAQDWDAQRVAGAAKGPGRPQTDAAKIVTQSQILRALTGSNASPKVPQSQRQRLGPLKNAKRPVGSSSQPRRDNTKAAAAPSIASQWQRRREVKLRQKMETTAQWGYIRHQVPEESREEEKTRFRFWKSWISKITFGDVSVQSAPWRNDGLDFAKLKSHQAMLDAWHQLDINERREFWPRLMLSTLSHDARKASQVLAATLDPLPPGYALIDVLNLIADNDRASYYRRGKNMRNADRLLDLVLYLIHHTPSGYIPFVQRTFGKLARNLPPYHAKELHAALQEAGAALHPHTKLHFADTLAGAAIKSQYKDEAFGILKEVGEDAEVHAKPRFASVLTSLLWCEPLDNAQAKEFSPSDCVQYFMEAGHVPNMLTFTSFLRTLCRRREWVEAIRLAKLFSNSVQPLDAKALQTIFNGAKSSLDADKVRDVLEFSKKSTANKVAVFNNALHSVYYFADAEFAQRRELPASDHQPFVTLLGVYVEKFELEPLQWLIPEMLPLLLDRQDMAMNPSIDESPSRRFRYEHSIVPVVKEFYAADGCKKVKPDATTLAIMLRAYIKSLWRPYDLMSFYSFYKIRLEEVSRGKGEYRDTLLSQGSVIHDTLIHAMLKQNGLTRPALEVFGDMLKERIKTLESKEDDRVRSADSKAAMHPEPSVFTFSILLHSLFLRKETALVEQIIKVMHENGIEPNLVTWNTLIGGYALMQNVPKTVKALRELETTGHVPDEHTYKAFSKLNNQKEALEMIQRIIDRNAQTLGSNDSLA
ncbi:hypothetical protein N3K66_004533 [Trichothecium roseum]|uniref:Uncharacterized protein n=1 Tax=Trichothecium roseum TaxID=47278 RepID=A0ACC0V3B7_9HYPO|nr:hypothetical protein N3K66_004533 [Trichothecium roseum]